MLIVCPSCATSYDVETASLQPDGRQVRCVRCRTVWHAEPSSAVKLLAAAEAIAPGPPAALPAVRRPQPVNEIDWSNHSLDEPSAPDDSPERLADEFAPGLASADTAVPSETFGDSVEMDAPPVVPVDLDEDHPPIVIDADDAAEHGITPLQDIETYAESFAARQRRRIPNPKGLRWPLSHLQTGILALLVVDAVVVGWRNDFVRALPQTASFYSRLGLAVNLRGLAFQGITTTTEHHEGVPILVVEGDVVNDTRKIADVPRLKFAVRNAANQEIYSWTAVPPRTMLPPGEAVSFRTRLASPPPEARDVLVRFVNRRDILTGER